MRSNPLISAACALWLLAVVPAAKAADDNFSLSIAPYAWFTSVKGTIGVKGFKTDIDQSFSDLWDDSDDLFGIFGRAEAHLGKFGLYVDGGYMKIGADHVSGPLGLADVDVTQSIGIIDFGLMYRLLELPADTTDGAFKFTLDATGGARYWTMGLEFDPANFATQKGGKAWIDPTVGLRGTIDIGKHLQIVLGGDIGGFGAASQFTWSAVGTVGYVFNIGNVESSVFAGYKAIGDDYSNGGFTWDAVLYGPVFGMSFTF